MPFNPKKSLIDNMKEYNKEHTQKFTNFLSWLQQTYPQSDKKNEICQALYKSFNSLDDNQKQIMFEALKPEKFNAKENYRFAHRNTPQQHCEMYKIYIQPLSEEKAPAKILPANSARTFPSARQKVESSTEVKPKTSFKPLGGKS